MKNLLAITLGTRDIQIRLSALHPNEWQQEKNLINHKTLEAHSFPGYLPPDFADTFCFSQPRTAGVLIVEKYETILPILHFPLLQPVVDFLKQKDITLDHILLLCTDQSEEFNAGLVKLKDYQNDTLYFGEIVARFLQEYLSLSKEQVEIYHVTKEVTNMDYLYTHFADKGSHFFSINPEEIEKIYLLPQGGIDHINQAFTLKLIQQFGEKVMQLQKAEGQEPKQLNFPRLFLNDLYRQRRLQHLHDFEFGLLAESINRGHKALSVVKRLAEWGDAKLHLRFDELPAILIATKPRLVPEFYNWLEAESRNTILLQLQGLTVMCMIQWQQGNMSDLLWRLFTLAENLFKTLLETEYGWPDTKDYYIPGPPVERNESWEVFLGKEMVELLQSKNIYISNPNRYAYQAIYLKMAESKSQEQQELLQRIGAAINTLARMRNKLAHHMKPINALEMNKALLVMDFDIPQLFASIGSVINLPNPHFALKVQKELEPLLIS